MNYNLAVSFLCRDIFQHVVVVTIQGAYNSGKPGNLREFVHSGKLREFKIYSGNLSDAVSL